jgi:hypothetical protein
MLQNSGAHPRADQVVQALAFDLEEPDVVGEVTFVSAGRLTGGAASFVKRSLTRPVRSRSC